MQKRNWNFLRSSVCELLKDQPLDAAGTRDAHRGPCTAQFSGSLHTDTLCQSAAANEVYLELC